jgi:hypothetical protein
VSESRNQRLSRARPVLALAAVAFAIGAIVGVQHGSSPASALADRFVAAWTRGDYATMYSEISTASRRSVSAGEFASAYQDAWRIATTTDAHQAGHARSVSGGAIAVPVRVQTRIFGTLSLPFTISTTQVGGTTYVRWSRSLAFPGLRAGELLGRRMTLPRRAPLLARDGSVLAEASSGPAPGEQPAETTRDSPLGAAANAVVGSVGPAPAKRRAALEEQGVPPGATVGLSGLELALDAQLRGVPGGELLAGRRVLAYATPHPARAVRTTVSPQLQRDAVTSLGGQLGGIVAMKPNGEVLAVAGLGLDGLQPPGSTFKMVTLTGVLTAKLATPSTVFPYATHATLDGVTLNNANGEECGGTLTVAFAVSCNSVFTPLGVKLGAPRLVATAERLGFNQQPGIAGAPPSTLPPASRIQGELDVGSTAIGQGEVLATPLEMAAVAATVADGGRRPIPTFVPRPSASQPRAMSASVARTVRRLMIGVVRGGTGTSAAIHGVTVAGKTGTAELRSSCPSASRESASGEESESRSDCAGGENEPSNTDAWFAAFAPALRPRIVVCVLLVKDGAGGDTAAPVAREVMEAAL